MRLTKCQYAQSW